MADEIKKDGKYTYGEHVAPYRTIAFFEFFMAMTEPISSFLETLKKSTDYTERSIAEVGASLLRDAEEHWTKMEKAFKESLGEVTIDVEVEESPSLWEFPSYLGVNVEPKAKEAHNGKGA